MAEIADVSKQVWKFQEGLLFLALNFIYGKKEKIYWNYLKNPGSTKKYMTPDDMSIDPDIVIGDKKNSPHALVFVTHATAEHASEKKFWRTVAEVIEEKKLASHPMVYSVLYSGRVKANIMTAYENLFDGTYHLDEHPDGIKLSGDLMQYTAKFGNKSPEDCLPILIEYINNNPKVWKAYYSRVKSMIDAGQGKYHNTLVNVSVSKSTRMPKARATLLRRGMAKIYALPSETRKELLQGKTELREVPYFSLLLQMFKPTVSHRYRLIDEEIKYVLEHFSQDDILLVMRETDRLDSFMEYAKNLQNIQVRGFCNNWIIDHFEELCHPENLQKWLEVVFHDPVFPISNDVLPQDVPQTNWLFEQIMTLLQVESGRKDGFGYSRLGVLAGHSEISNLPGVYVTPYINRRKPIKRELLIDISRVFSDNLSRIGRDESIKLFSKIEKAYCESIFKYKMMGYSRFNPIDWIIYSKLSASGLSTERPVVHPSFLADDVAGITTSTGNMIKVGSGHVWIKCQSAYDGKTDKRKELCGRVGAMKLAYSAEELQNIRLYLVIDGLFNDEDIALLDKAGWDGIFYCDELDAIQTAVKSMVK